MPISIAQMMKKTRKIEVDFQGDTFGVVYRVNAVTSDLLKKLDGVAWHESLVEQVEAAVESWEVLDEKGKAKAVTTAFLQTLPTDFLSCVLTAITKDMQAPGADEKKD